MKLGIVGDGLLAHLLLSHLSDSKFDGEIVWFRGRTPTTPPVALLHKHVGQSFYIDEDRQEAWDVACHFFGEVESTTNNHVVSEVEILRPTSKTSRLSKSYERIRPQGVQVRPASDFPYLQHCDQVFSYSGYAIDPSKLFKGLEQKILSTLKIQEVRPLKHFISSEKGDIQVADMRDQIYHFDQVVISSGASSARWLHGVDLRAWPGELAVSARPDGLPTDVAVSRHGQVVPLVDGSSVCSGATYLLPDGPNKLLPTRRDPKTAIEEALQGVRKGVTPIEELLQQSPPPASSKTFFYESGSGEQSEVKSWYGIRAIHHPDRRPIVGRIDKTGVIVATALGSKGMFWAPIVSQVTTALINDDINESPLKSICASRIPTLGLTLA